MVYYKQFSYPKPLGPITHCINIYKPQILLRLSFNSQNSLNVHDYWNNYYKPDTCAVDEYASLRISWEYLIEKLMYAVPIYKHDCATYSRK